MTYRYIYKITCTVGRFKGKFYYGQHTTKNLDDGYKGSSKLLRDYYKKHPNDFIKEIISFHKTKDELNQAEYDIIHPWLNHHDCLNIKEGGKGGSFKGINKGIIHDEKWNNKISKNSWLKNLDNPKYDESHKKWCESLKKSNHSHIVTEEERKKRSEKLKGRIITEEWKKKISESLKGKHLSEEHRKHLSESQKGIIPKNKGKHKVYNDLNDKSKGFHYE